MFSSGRSRSLLSALLGNEQHGSARQARQRLHNTLGQDRRTTLRTRQSLSFDQSPPAPGQPEAGDIRLLLVQRLVIATLIDPGQPEADDIRLLQDLLGTQFVESQE